MIHLCQSDPDPDPEDQDPFSGSTCSKKSTQKNHPLQRAPQRSPLQSPRLLLRRWLLVGVPVPPPGDLGPWDPREPEEEEGDAGRPSCVEKNHPSLVVTKPRCSMYANTAYV